MCSSKMVLTGAEQHCFHLLVVIDSFPFVFLLISLRIFVSPPRECSLRWALVIARHHWFSSACFECLISFCLFLFFIAPAVVLRSFRNLVLCSLAFFLISLSFCCTCFMLLWIDFLWFSSCRSIFSCSQSGCITLSRLSLVFRLVSCSDQYLCSKYASCSVGDHGILWYFVHCWLACTIIVVRSMSICSSAAWLSSEKEAFCISLFNLSWMFCQSHLCATFLLYRVTFVCSFEFVPQINMWHIGGRSKYPNSMAGLNSTPIVLWSPGIVGG